MTATLLNHSGRNPYCGTTARADMLRESRASCPPGTQQLQCWLEQMQLIACCLQPVVVSSASVGQLCLEIPFNVHHILVATHIYYFRLDSQWECLLLQYDHSPDSKRDYLFQLTRVQSAMSNGCPDSNITMKKTITVIDVGRTTLSNDSEVKELLQRVGVKWLLHDDDNGAIIVLGFESLVDGGTYTLGTPLPPPPQTPGVSINTPSGWWHIFLYFVFLPPAKHSSQYCVLFPPQQQQQQQQQPTQIQTDMQTFFVNTNLSQLTFRLLREELDTAEKENGRRPFIDLPALPWTTNQSPQCSLWRQCYSYILCSTIAFLRILSPNLNARSKQGRILTAGPWP
jgi:hypothetical protein